MRASAAWRGSGVGRSGSTYSDGSMVEGLVSTVAVSSMMPGL